MAQTDALSIFQANGTDEEKLAESYGALVDQIQKTGLYQVLRTPENQISGNPSSGSVVVRRLRTSTVRNYGTARGNQEGDKITNNGQTLNIDQRKEIVEEVNKFDVRQFGLPGIIDRRRENFSLSVARYFDTQFFTAAIAAGTNTDVSGEADTYDKVEALIQAVETTSNANVDGVDRDLIALTLNPATYGKLKKQIQTLPNGDNGVQTPTFNGVKVYSNHRQSKDAVVQVIGSVALVADIIDFKFETIQLSADDALSLFFNYGVKVVMPDLVRYADVLEEESV